MEIYAILTEIIDLRSFSNLWFWIALAVMWSSTSHWVLGIPHDMIQRAKREGGQAMALGACSASGTLGSTMCG